MDEQTTASPKTAIPAILGLIEGIIWLTQSDEVWLAKYGDR